MKNILDFKTWQVNEGWKENILLGISSFLSTTGWSGITKTADKEPHKIEIVSSDIKQDKLFYSACFQLCIELKSSPPEDLEFYQRRGLAEAALYFQAKRDKKSEPKLSKWGKAATLSVMRTLKEFDESKIKELANRGLTGDYWAEFTGN